MSSSNVLSEIETALTSAENIIPMLAPILSLIPGGAAFAPFLQLLPVAVEAVQTIQKATGGTQAAAMTQVMAHLTPGLPNAPVLSDPSRQGGG